MVPAPKDCLYLALSYVWGEFEAVTTQTSDLDARFPPTIEDGITVTLALGGSIGKLPKCLALYSTYLMAAVLQDWRTIQSHIF